MQREQGNDYFNNSPVQGLSSHINLLEDFDPDFINDPFHWIPQGIYYDLIDDRNDGAVPSPRNNIRDEVNTYLNSQFFNALDGDVFSIPQFRNRLLQENSNRQAIQVNNLFTDYGF